MKMVTPEKILQTINSWQSGEVIAMRRKKCSGASSRPILHTTLTPSFPFINECLCIRAGGGPGTFFSTHGNHLPWLSGVHGLKDFLCSAHLHESFGGRIYSLKHFHKSKFVLQRTHEDAHSRENPSNHELLTVRGGDCRASKKMFRGLLPPY